MTDTARLADLIDRTRGHYTCGRDAFGGCPDPERGQECGYYHWVDGPAEADEDVVFLAGLVADLSGRLHEAHMAEHGGCGGGLPGCSPTAGWSCADGEL